MGTREIIFRATNIDIGENLTEKDLVSLTYIVNRLESNLDSKVEYNNDNEN